MVKLIREHRFNHADVVSNSVKMRDGVGHPNSTFPILGKLAWRTHEFGGSSRKCESFAFDKLVGGDFSVAFNEFGFVIKNIEVRRTA
jgi:hypothetical protein